jgi:hypothetical protein
VDRDLEVICLKCLEKDPARRYNSAASLADDLERFLRHEPIRARPVSSLRRFGLWCRRRPALVSAWAALAVALMAGMFAWQWRRESGIRHTALQQVREELAQQAISSVRDTRLRGQPGRRLESLPRLAAPAQIAPTLALRNEAVACLALFDLRDSGVQFAIPYSTKNLAFTHDLEQIAVVRQGFFRSHRRTVHSDLRDGKVWRLGRTGVRLLAEHGPGGRPLQSDGPAGRRGGEGL